MQKIVQFGCTFLMSRADIKDTIVSGSQQTMNVTATINKVFVASNSLTPFDKYSVELFFLSTDISGRMFGYKELKVTIRNILAFESYRIKDFSEDQRKSDNDNDCWN